MKWHVHDVPSDATIMEDLGETQVPCAWTISLSSTKTRPEQHLLGPPSSINAISHRAAFRCDPAATTRGGKRSRIKQRISRAEWEDPSSAPHEAPQETRELGVMGQAGRTHGSLPLGLVGGKERQRSWRGCNRIAVLPGLPVGGRNGIIWDGYKRKARYSLIVSIEAPESRFNFYTPITT